MARETFGVENVAARIYDPRRAEVYQRLGIPTVATVRWTADQMMRRLLPSDVEPHWQDQSGELQLAEVPVAAGWIGHRLSRLEQAAAVRVAFVTRLGVGTLPTPDMVVQDGDLVHMMTRTADLKAVEAVFAKGPEEH